MPYSHIRKLTFVDCIVDSDTPLNPEERLLTAIFERALRDCIVPEKYVTQDARRTARYYFCNLDTVSYGTFGHFCSHFNFCPSRIKKLVLTDTMRQRLLELGKAKKGDL